MRVEGKMNIYELFKHDKDYIMETVKRIHTDLKMR